MVNPLFIAGEKFVGKEVAKEGVKYALVLAGGAVISILVKDDEDQEEFAETESSTS